MESSLLVYILMVIKRNNADIRSELKIYIKRIDIIWGVVAYLAMALTSIGLNYLLPIPLESGFTLVIKYLTTNSHILTLFFLFIYICLLAPIIEEVVFRGYVWEIFEKKKVNKYLILIVTSILFAVVHLEFQMFPLLFLSGIIFGLVRMYTNRLGASIVVHMISNIIAIVSTVVFYS